VSLRGRGTLRIALLDITEPVDAALPLRRGFVRVGGRPLAQHQLDIAIVARCERIICLVRSLDPGVIALQHRAEALGILFNTVIALRDLSALVSAQDDIIVFHGGLLADPASAVELIEQGAGVFVQPVQTGLAAGFERIDINYATAGLLRIPGRLIETLMQMSPDCDVPSTLTRVALQARIETREVPASVRSGMGWHMITSELQAHSIEPDWIAKRLGRFSQSGPAKKIARAGVSAFGPSLLHAGNASTTLASIAIALLAMAVAAAWFNLATGAFLICALAWLALSGASTLKRLEAPVIETETGIPNSFAALDWLFDGILVLLIHWAAPPIAGTNLILSLALPMTSLLLLRIYCRIPTIPGVGLLGDRALLSLSLAPCTILGFVEWAVALGAVALAAVILVFSSDRGG